MVMRLQMQTIILLNSSNNNKTIVLQVNMEGLVTYFKDLTYSNVK